MIPADWGALRAKLLDTPCACDTDTIDQGDELEVNVSALEGDLVVQNKTKGTEFFVVHDLSEREMEMIKAGGLLAYAA